MKIILSSLSITYKSLQGIFDPSLEGTPYERSHRFQKRIGNRPPTPFLRRKFALR